MTAKDMLQDLKDIGVKNAKIIGENKALMNYLDNGGFFEAPASTKYHGAYKGGLYHHCFNVCNRLLELTNKLGLKWQRPESPAIIGLFHDLCKCDQYIPVKDENKFVSYIYNNDTLLKGHGAKSVMILSQYMTLTEEEILCIRYHMGAYEQDEWAEFDRAIRKYPNVLYTHTADMLASKVDE